jgi:hypothetical protein
MRTAVFRAEFAWIDTRSGSAFPSEAESRRHLRSILNAKKLAMPLRHGGLLLG